VQEVKDQISVLTKFNKQFQQKCKEANIKIKIIHKMFDYTVYEYENSKPLLSEPTKTDLLFIIKQIYENQLTNPPIH